MGTIYPIATRQPRHTMEAQTALPSPAAAPEIERARQLADTVACVITEDLCALASVTRSTADTWAKRGEGPPFVYLGNRRLYPRAALQQFILDRVKSRGVSARDLL